MNSRSEDMIARYIAAGCTRFEASVLETMSRALAAAHIRDDCAERVAQMLESGKTYIECANWIKAQQ